MGAKDDERLVDGIIAAWNDTGVDPAEARTPETPASSADVWRLIRIQASGFGGLTLFGGPPFDLRLRARNWCLLGQNGSGKTSLASAILWALTGKAIREQEGPVHEYGERSGVTDGTGKKLGDWPSFASFPQDPGDLTKKAGVWVRLTFVNQRDETAIAYRRMECPLGGDPTFEEDVDHRLLAAPELLETGLLMPARLTLAGFGKKGRPLYEAVKMLTGLDQLSDIAEDCRQLSYGNRRFLRYGKAHGLESYRSAFSKEMDRAVRKAADLEFALPKDLALGRESLVADIKKSASAASRMAGAHLRTLKSEIAPAIDTAAVQGRAKVRKAVGKALGIVGQGPKGIDRFRAWTALKQAMDDRAFASLPRAVQRAHARLDSALAWHAKQRADRKFRLKALAAQYFVPPHEHSVPARCPLCEAHLSTAGQQALAKELAGLRKSAAEAERKLEDVCRGLDAELVRSVPAGLRRYRDVWSAMNPRADFVVAMRERFCEGAPFGSVLVGLASWIESKVNEHVEALPSFLPAASIPAAREPPPAIKLRRLFHELNRLVGLVTWWSEHRGAFRSAWADVIGTMRGDGSFPSNSVQGRLRAMDEALSKAYPLDELCGSLLEAASWAERWAHVRKRQDLREAIAAALRPLTVLDTLVAAETARSIHSLSGRIATILGRIHLNERLAFEKASLGKQTVNFDGSFEPGMQIDAALVANKSWLRAILWAFVLALREETINGLGANPFPLIVLDDPQTSFDPRNKRKWAQELARIANIEPADARGAQLFLTTHEREFYQCMVDVEKLNCEKGLIAGVNKTSRVAKIVNAGWLRRTWLEALENNDDSRARDYIAKVRIYCEDLLKFMLRGEHPEISDFTLGRLKQELARLRKSHVQPFDRSAFADLLKTLGDSGGKPMRLLNMTHHKDDESIGLAQARDVKDFWDDKLRNRIESAFAAYDRFESFYGEPRTFPWAKTVIQFPDGFRNDLKTLRLRESGIAAAAKTDGVAGDGVVTVKEWKQAREVTLPNHEVYQLTAETLDPVAAVGDLVIVCNHANVNPRNLVVAAHENSLLARRYNTMEAHPEIAVLTGQSVDPYAVPEPVIVESDRSNKRKIVGTLFSAHLLPFPSCDSTDEIVPLKDSSVPRKMLDKARLFKVRGRSAEPIALNGQFLIAREPAKTVEQVKSLDGRPVVAIDEDGTRYFKRLCCRGNLAVLESLNQDGTTGVEVLSIDGMNGFAKITQALEVIGVLFEVQS